MTVSKILSCPPPDCEAFQLAAGVNAIEKQAPPGWNDSRAPLLAVVLGSGLGGLAEQIESSVSLAYARIAGLPPATAAGHRGEFLLGWLGSARIIAMAGRLHAYEGHRMELLCRPLALLVAMRPAAVILSCAAGGLNPRYQVGDLVVIDEHINLLHGQLGAAWLPERSAGRESGPSSSNRRRDPATIDDPTSRHDLAIMRSGRPTCDELFAELAVHTSRECGFRLQRGTYLAVTGPNYETRAECRMMRSWGADLVGMSTVPEIVLASRAGLRTIALGVVTNMAVPDAAAPASHQDVIAAAGDAGAKLETIVRAIASSLDQGQEL